VPNDKTMKTCDGVNCTELICPELRDDLHALNSVPDGVVLQFLKRPLVKRVSVIRRGEHDRYRYFVGDENKP